MSRAEIVFKACAAIVVALVLSLFERWRRIRSRKAARAQLLEFCRTFPGRCPICSYRRWGQQMGFDSAFKPSKPHPCPEADRRSSCAAFTQQGEG